MAKVLVCDITANSLFFPVGRLWSADQIVTLSSAGGQLNSRPIAADQQPVIEFLFRHASAILSAAKPVGKPYEGRPQRHRAKPEVAPALYRHRRG